MKTFGALNIMNFEIENYVRYKTFQIGKNVRYKKFPKNLAIDRELSLEFIKINFGKQIPQYSSSK